MKSKSGFTLIEVLVVIAVISIISSIIVIAFVGQQRHSRDTKRITDLVSVTEAFDRYYAENGSYPLTCGITSLGYLSCDSGVISSVYNGFQPATITPTTSRDALSAALPQITRTFGNPSTKGNDPPINHRVSGSIVTTSYFVFSPDLLPGQSSSVNGTVSFYANRGQTSTFTCSFVLQPNAIGNPNTKPHRYVVGFYSETDEAWKFYMNPQRNDIHNLQWTSPTTPNPCAVESTGQLKLLSSS